MPDPTIPAAVVCRVLAAVCESKVRQLNDRLNHNPCSAPSKVAGRREELERLKRQTGRLYALADRCHGVRVDALVLGLLASAAQGHTEALRDLEDRLERLGHPALARVLNLPGEDVAGIAEAVLKLATHRTAGGG